MHQLHDALGVGRDLDFHLHRLEHENPLPRLDALAGLHGDVPEGCEAVRSPMTASVWQVAVEPGQRVEAGQRILVLEAMKMEVEITAHAEGVVELVHCAKGAMVTAGQNLATVRVDV